ncbi:hypothetical protein [uncultured Ruminococcus sp.]|uniref:hypothetical protein n=1 Tax=uncultured Ruminococcus sp. TaxID=165186 RepID=UPI0025F1F4B7|nr:hypothetical protein [uncultured Ruminococcus sp.]
MADENDIINADDTQDTETPTVEEQLAALQEQTALMAQQIAALQALADEEEYELRYSGEDIDSLLDGGRAVFNYKSAVELNKIISRFFPLVMKWGSFTLNMTVNADNGQQWSYNTLKNVIPAGLTNPTVFMICDWNKKHFKSQSFGYKVNGNDIDWEAYLEHTSDQGGTYAFKVYYLIIGKNSGGGQIG